MSWTIARKETRVEPVGMGNNSLGHISLDVVLLGRRSLKTELLGNISEIGKSIAIAPHARGECNYIIQLLSVMGLLNRKSKEKGAWRKPASKWWGVLWDGC